MHVHARNGPISTSGLKSDVTIVLKADIGLLDICMGFQDLLA